MPHEPRVAEGVVDGPGAALGPYLRAVRRRPLVVLASALLAVFAAGLWLAGRESRYDATARLVVNPIAQTDTTFLGLPLLRDTGDATRNVQTAVGTMQGQSVAAEAVRRLGDGSRPDDVGSRVSVTAAGESNVVSVTAEASSPERAARTADAYATAILALRRRALDRALGPLLAGLRGQLAALTPAQLSGSTLQDRVDQLGALSRTGDPTVALAEVASAPAASVGAHRGLVVALALLAGAVIGSLIALLLELLDRRLRSEAELRELWPLPVLAHVPEVPDARMRGPVGVEAAPAELHEAYRSLAAELDAREPPWTSLAVTSASAGDGTTTTVAHLGAALGARGHQVVAAELDARRPTLARALGVNGSAPGLAGLLDRRQAVADPFNDVPGLPRLRLLPAGRAASPELAERLSRAMPELLAVAAKGGDVVVLDTAPLGEVSDGLTAAVHADGVLVVVRPGHTDRAALLRLRDLLDRIGRTPIGVVIVGSGGPWARARLRPSAAPPPAPRAPARDLAAV